MRMKYGFWIVPNYSKIGKIITASQFVNMTSSLLLFFSCQFYLLVLPCYLPSQRLGINLDRSSKKYHYIFLNQTQGIAALILLGLSTCVLFTPLIESVNGA